MIIRDRFLNVQMFKREPVLNELVPNEQGTKNERKKLNEKET